MKKKKKNQFIVDHDMHGLFFLLPYHSQQNSSSEASFQSALREKIL